MRLSPENEFILRSLCLFLGKEDSNHQTDFPWDHLNWKRTVSVGRHQNLFPLLYHVLSQRGWLEKVPSWVREKCQEGFFDHTALNLLYDHFLKEILAILDEGMIPFIVLKGPSMAIEFYHPRELRPYTDLDLLIKREDYEKVRNILLTLEFKVSNPEGEAIRRKYFNSVSFSKIGSQEIDLDLHWETVMTSWNARPFLSDDQVWQDRRWLEFSGMRLPVLQPHMLLLYLSLHLTFHHQFGKLLTLCDLDLVVQKFGRQLNWEDVLRRSKEMKIRKSVYYSLKFSNALLKTEVPEPVLRSLEQKKFEERLLPFEYLVFREKNLPPTIERFVKFMIIDDLHGKISSLTNFYRQWWAKKQKIH